jgi:DNA-binding FadR family transcriptional regulator
MEVWYNLMIDSNEYKAAHYDSLREIAELNAIHLDVWNQTQAAEEALRQLSDNLEKLASDIRMKEQKINVIRQIVDAIESNDINEANRLINEYTINWSWI